MKRAWLLVPFLVAAASTGEARADVLSLRVEAHAGGGGGLGLGGAAKDQAFFEGARGGAYGGLVGLEVLFLDVWVEHHQYLGTSALDSNAHFLGTWTQFMAGLDLDFEKRSSVSPAEQQKGVKGKKKSYMEIGLGLGYGVGTGQQVDLPLDAAQLTDKGFLLEGRFSAGFWVGEHAGLGFGITIPVSGGYFFKQGFANNADNQYYQAEAAALLVVRGKLKIK